MYDIPTKEKKAYIINIWCKGCQFKNFCFKILSKDELRVLSMFPFFPKSCCGWDFFKPESRKTHQENKLKFLKWMRDELETRLAGLNAAIQTIERQIDQD